MSTTKLCISILRSQSVRLLHADTPTYVATRLYENETYLRARLAIWRLPVASDHTIVTIESFSISMLCGSVMSEIKVYGRWVSTRLLMAYKRASLASSLNHADPLAIESTARCNSAQGGVIVHSKLIGSRSGAYCVCIGTAEISCNLLPAFCRTSVGLELS